MLLEKVKFEITTEDGTQELTIPEYRRDEDLWPLIGRQATPPMGRRTLFMGKQIFSFSEKYLLEKPQVRRIIEDLEKLYEANPLKYFVPQHQSVVDFLNWRCESGADTLKVLHAGVGTGKSVAGCIDWLLDVVPCQKDWPIFEFGVNWREFRGPYKDGGVALVSYAMLNHQTTLWPQVIRRWCPPGYAEDYFTGKKRISWRAGPKMEIAETPILFLASNQADTAFVSMALNIIHWDEQSSEDKFNNAADRARRRGGRHIMTMTPHHIPGRADTGAGSYVDRIRKNELVVAQDSRFFPMDIDGVTPWVVPEDEKRARYKEWIEEPTKAGNRKKLAEGRSKLYGEFHESSGLVFDSWERAIHLIPRFEVPSYWTFYRYHDHGRKEPNACILVAVNEENDYFIIDNYYERDVEIKDAAAGIIAMSGNRVEGGEFAQEVFQGREIVRTISDPRSLSKSLDNSPNTIQEEYMRHGLVLTHGNTEQVQKLIWMTSDLFVVDENRTHFYTKEKGAPRLYVFDDLHEFVREIENYRMKPVKVVAGNAIVTQEKPVMKNDHDMTCVNQLAADRPMYIPKRVDRWDRDDTSCVTTSQGRDPLTGY